MFSSPAYAQAAGSASSGQSMLMLAVPYIAIFAIFYFLMIRPQQQRAKKHRAMVDAAKKGDVVVTGGGFVGKITRVLDDEIEVELAPSVKVRVVKGTLTDVRVTGKPTPANDAAA